MLKGVELVSRELCVHIIPLLIQETVLRVGQRCNITSISVCMGTHLETIWIRPCISRFLVFGETFGYCGTHAGHLERCWRLKRRFHVDIG